MSDRKESVFLVLKVSIATLLEILCLGACISAKLLLCPNSGSSSRFSSKLWFDHISWTLGTRVHFDAVLHSRSRDLPEPWLRQVKCAEPGRGCSGGKSGKGFSSWSSRNWSLLTFRLSLSLSSSRVDAMKRQVSWLGEGFESFSLLLIF